MRWFLVNRASTENVNGVQPEIEVEAQPPRNIANDFNPNEIERDSWKKKQIFEYPPNIQDQLRKAYVLKGPMQPALPKFLHTEFGSLPQWALRRGICLVIFFSAVLVLFLLTISILASFRFWIYSHLTTKFILIANLFFYIVVPSRTLATWRVCLYARFILCFSFGKNEQVGDVFDRGGWNCTITYCDIWYG
mgnify:CR=1 FL=1